MGRRPLVVATGLALTAALAAAPASAGEPTCTELDGLDLDIVVHGQHVVRDYVMGVTTWPPAGSRDARGGAVLPGGPGPGAHFGGGVAPGASFCTDSSSPGVHLAG